MLAKTLVQMTLVTEVSRQGLSQDLETGCLKLAIVKFLGIQIFRGYHNILRFQPLIKIRHDILIECHRDYLEMKKVKSYA